MGSKERRREALSQLDHLLEQLERANLAGHRSPPPSVVRELVEWGLSNARAHTIPELIEVVFNRQELLMRANKDAQRNGARLQDRDPADGPASQRSPGPAPLGPIWW